MDDLSSDDIIGKSDGQLGAALLLVRTATRRLAIFTCHGNAKTNHFKFRLLKSKMITCDHALMIESTRVSS
jgi:hypothetical protein